MMTSGDETKRVEIDAGFEVVPDGEWEVEREVFSSRYGGMWSKVMHEHKQGTVEWFVRETQYGAPFATNTARSVLGAKLAAERAVNDRNKERTRELTENLFGELAKEALIDLARWEAGLGKEALDCWDDLTGKSAEIEQAERARQVTEDLNEAFTDFNKAIGQYLDDVKTMNDAAKAEASGFKWRTAKDTEGAMFSYTNKDGYRGKIAYNGHTFWWEVIDPTGASVGGAGVKSESKAKETVESEICKQKFYAEKPKFDWRKVDEHIWTTHKEGSCGQVTLKDDKFLWHVQRSGESLVPGTAENSLRKAKDKAEAAILKGAEER